MNTKIYKVKNKIEIKKIKEAAKIIKNGGLVVFPTETVYGIGANALNKEASYKIYNVKNRPSDNPLIIHIANPNDLEKYVTSIDDDALKLINSFWPGPLTIVFKKKDIIPNEITGGLDTVAFRNPKSEIARLLIKESNCPICAPSANISGKPSSTLFEHVYKDLNGKVEMIIDGGKSEVGLESTVLDMSTSVPTILRPGAITKNMIENVLNKKILKGSFKSEMKDIPKAPGMKYKHYSPSGEITIIFGTTEKTIEYINNRVKYHESMIEKSAVICSDELKSKIVCENIISLGSKNNPSEIASNIFSSLRKMDELNIRYIYIEELQIKDLGNAIMNRLLKASGNNVITLN